MVDGLLDRLQVKAGAAGAPAPLGLAVVEAAERDLGFALPTLLRRVYLEDEPWRLLPGRTLTSPATTTGHAQLAGSRRYRLSR